MACPERLPKMTPESDSIAALSNEIAGFVHERAWEQFHDPKNLVMLLASEVGELAAEFRWVETTRADAHADGSARQAIADEMADVAIALLMLASRTRINLASAVRKKLEKNAAKYPVNLAYGRCEPPRPRG